jgi:transposase
MYSKAATRRRHCDELKAKVLNECDEAGASVAAVAQAHGLNANLVHKWRRQGRPDAAASGARAIDDKVAGAFVALQLPAPQPAPDIRIELRRGATTVTIAWPGQAAGECAAWLGQWLR